MRTFVACSILALGAALTGCGEAEVRAAESRATSVVDSALPIPLALERFRGGLLRPNGLRGGASGREALVRSFVRTLETNDTTALRDMVLGKEEYAWLYYESSQFSRAPYELAPDLLWFQMQGQSERGAALLLAERSGAPLGYLDHECAPPRTEGENRVYGGCVLRRVTAQGDTVGERLFGLMLERGGAFKFVSYANTLD